MLNSHDVVVQNCELIGHDVPMNANHSTVSRGDRSPGQNFVVRNCVIRGNVRGVARPFAAPNARREGIADADKTVAEAPDASAQGPLAGAPPDCVDAARRLLGLRRPLL